VPNPNVFNKHEYIVGENFRANTEGTFGYDTVAKLWRYNDGTEKAITPGTPAIRGAIVVDLDVASAGVSTAIDLGIAGSQTVSFSEDLTLNGVNGQVAILVTGLYQISMTIVNSVMGDYSLTALRNNGGFPSGLTVRANSTGQVAPGFQARFVEQVVLIAGDFINFQGRQDNGGSNPIRARCSIIRLR
jgi:hypothetical protein